MMVSPENSAFAQQQMLLSREKCSDEWHRSASRWQVPRRSVDNVQFVRKRTASFDGHLGDPFQKRAHDMYRQHLKRMDSSEPQNNGLDPQIVTRLSNIPLLHSACEQLNDLYQNTKDSNSLLKFTLETVVEIGVVSVATTAMMPIVNKLEKPISALDTLVCDGLTRLEQRIPLITAPTDKVYEDTIKPMVELTEKVYGGTLKPVIDLSLNTVNSAKDFGVHKVNVAKNTINSVKNYGVDTITLATNYGVDTITSATNYGVDTITSATNYGVDTIASAKNYTVDTITSAKNYSIETIMSADKGSEAQIVARIWSIPMVNSAFEQLFVMYQQTKASNTLIKYTLETAESVATSAAARAMPLVNKFEKPICVLNLVACDGLDQLQQRVPLISAPTDEVYEKTLKPVVDLSRRTAHSAVNTVSATKDTINAVKDYSVEAISSAKDYTIGTITSAKDYTVDTITSVKDYSINTITSAKDYSIGTISSAKDYTVGTITSAKTYSVDKASSLKDYTSTKVDGVKTYSLETMDVVTAYGTDKVSEVLATHYGKLALGQLDGWLDTAEHYLDYYLHDASSKANGRNENGILKKNDLEKPSGLAPLRRAWTLSDRARQRLTAHALRDLRNVQMRTKDALDKLKFNVDLIQYAKTNMDTIHSNINDMTNKLTQLWAEINVSEEQAEKLALNSEQSASAVTTFEKRAIATARHLTLRVKTAVQYFTNFMPLLPTTITERLPTLKKYSDDLYNSFASAKSVHDMPDIIIAQAKDHLGYLQETVSFLSDYILSTPIINWMGLHNTGASLEQVKKEIDEFFQPPVQQIDGIQKKSPEQHDESTDEDEETSLKTVKQLTEFTVNFVEEMKFIDEDEFEE